MYGLIYHSNPENVGDSSLIFSRYNQWACDLRDSSAPIVNEKDFRGFIDGLFALISRGALSPAAKNFSRRDGTHKTITLSEIWEIFVSEDILPKMVQNNKHKEAATALKNCIEAFQEAGVNTHVFVGK